MEGDEQHGGRGRGPKPKLYRTVLSHATEAACTPRHSRPWNGKTTVSWLEVGVESQTAQAVVLCHVMAVWPQAGSSASHSIQWEQ